MNSSSIDIRSIRGQDNGRDQQTSGKRLQRLFQKEIQLGGARLPDKIKEAFYHELCILLEAGVDISTSLELATESQSKKRCSKMFLKLQVDIIEGKTLSAAMRNAGCFTPYEYFSVQIGEETGRLVQVLKELSVYYNKKITQRRQIIGAAAYPLIILLVAFCSMSFMIAYVVPMFADVLKRSGGELPAITKMVLWCSDVARSSFGYLLAGFTCLALIVVAQKNRPWYRRFFSSLLIKLPIFGAMINKIYLIRFCNTMSLLLSSKTPLLLAIELTQRMISFYPLENSLTTIREKITMGNSLHDSMSFHSIFPNKMILIVKVGEEVNQLDIFLHKIADQYNKDVEYHANMMGKILEPLIIIILGIVIGLMLIAMYLPLFKLGNSF